MKPEWQVTSCGSMLWSFARFTNDEVIGFRTPQLPFVKYEAFQTIFDDLLVILIGVRGGGLGGRPPPQAWKFSGQICFSGQQQVPQKSWIIKYISVQWKIPGQLCFSVQAQVAQKNWIKKIYIQYSKFRAPSVFQGKRKLPKNSECKKHIQYSAKIPG